MVIKTFKRLLTDNYLNTLYKPQYNIIENFLVYNKNQVIVAPRQVGKSYIALAILKLLHKHSYGSYVITPTRNMATSLSNKAMHTWNLNLAPYIYSHDEMMKSYGFLFKRFRYIIVDDFFMLSDEKRNIIMYNFFTKQSLHLQNILLIGESYGSAWEYENLIELKHWNDCYNDKDYESELSILGDLL